MRSEGASQGDISRATHRRPRTRSASPALVRYFREVPLSGCWYSGKHEAIITPTETRSVSSTKRAAASRAPDDPLTPAPTAYSAQKFGSHVSPWKKAMVIGQASVGGGT